MGLNRYSLPRSISVWIVITLSVIILTVWVNQVRLIAIDVGFPDWHVSRTVTIWELSILLVGCLGAAFISTKLASWEKTAKRNLTAYHRVCAIAVCLAPPAIVFSLFVGPLYAENGFGTRTEWFAELWPAATVLAGTMMTFAALALILTTLTSRITGSVLAFILYGGLIIWQSIGTVATRYLPLHGDPINAAPNPFAALGVGLVFSTIAVFGWRGGVKKIVDLKLDRLA